MSKSRQLTYIAGKGAKLSPSQSSKMGRLALCKYTCTFLLACIRNCRHAVTITLSETSVMCIAPATWPHIMSECDISLRYRAANGVVPFCVQGERLTTQCVR